MPLSFIKKIVRHRTIITAIANAAITWVVLIIAPLGLFAVIACTLGVFIGSLVVGNFSDRALLFLINNSDRQNFDSSYTATLEANNDISEPRDPQPITRDKYDFLAKAQNKKLIK